ncbi:hypothetical protein GCM10010495_07590 [Kitasatospora herbaricolor]|uniref:hypothetical protein n=1 Tax=Kitasatospora herbaricolor TaxID=68217 RepID=UPI00174B7C0A|nr:hypothetical protein [Kitasatospora herbaricolor]MDQ0309803.1 hypothetical protein [Kitasatospora herbaricolor]GGU99489.1 hypothetical protein GCM10010495_07590 [Kitasatospora herbaricolor]
MSDTTVGPVPSDAADTPTPTPDPTPTPTPEQARTPDPTPEQPPAGDPGTPDAPGLPYPAPGQAAVEPAPPAAPRGTGSRILRGAAATVAAALVGVVIGVGIIEVRYDDPAPAAAAGPGPGAAPAPAPSPTAFGAKSNGNHFGGLRDLLLPVPAGFALGPDYGSYGNDTELTAEQLAAEVDEGVKDVPADKRERVKQYWNGLHVKGTGVRTFKSSAGDLVVSLKLRQFNQQEVQKENEYTAIFTGDTGLFRTGPEIPGHPEAHCYLMPVAPGAQIDYLECSAAEGDLLVVMDVEGVAQLPKDKIVSLFTAQLDRLASPGASA